MPLLMPGSGTRRGRVRVSPRPELRKRPGRSECWRVSERIPWACRPPSEAVAARWAGMKVCGVSLVTNPGAGLSGVALSHAEVLAAAAFAPARGWPGF